MADNSSYYRLQNLEQTIGYGFQDVSLLEQALTHRSYSAKHNERLEFLGDSILGMVIASALFKQFPQQPEGVLTRLRSVLVRETTLAKLGREFDLGDCLRLGAGELKSGGYRRESLIADAVEAIIGAIYIDSHGQLELVNQLVLKWFKSRLEAINPDITQKDPKSALQELLQKLRLGLPTYRNVRVSGNENAQIFEVALKVPHIEHELLGSGSSKRRAEQKAASSALDYIATHPTKELNLQGMVLPPAILKDSGDEDGALDLAHALAETSVVDTRFDAMPTKAKKKAAQEAEAVLKAQEEAAKVATATATTDTSAAANKDATATATTATTAAGDKDASATTSATTATTASVAASSTEAAAEKSTDAIDVTDTSATSSVNSAGPAANDSPEAASASAAATKAERSPTLSLRPTHEPLSSLMQVPNKKHLKNKAQPVTGSKEGNKLSLQSILQAKKGKYAFTHKYESGQMGRNAKPKAAIKSGRPQAKGVVFRSSDH